MISPTIAFPSARRRRRLFPSVLVAWLLVIVAGPSAAEDAPRYYWGPHMWDGGRWMVFGPFSMILLLAVLVACAIVLVRWLGRPGIREGGSSRTPLDILRERFARGEIDKGEFEERKKILGA